MKLIPVFLLVGMLSLNGWAEEKEFRGWKKGDWVRIDLSVEPNNDAVCEVADALRQEASPLLILVSYTIWAKIHEVSSEHLLVTTYFASRISIKDQYEQLAEKKKPQVSPVKDKYSLETKQIIGIHEWPRGGEPPRPWWPL